MEPQVIDPASVSLIPVKQVNVTWFLPPKFQGESQIRNDAGQWEPLSPVANKTGHTIGYSLSVDLSLGYIPRLIVK